MNGKELRAWRKRNAYSQDALREELGVKSRGTISAWENSEEPLSRTIELALTALEALPELRKVDGRRYSSAEQTRIRKSF